MHSKVHKGVHRHAVNKLTKSQPITWAPCTRRDLLHTCLWVTAPHSWCVLEASSWHNNSTASCTRPYIHTCPWVTAPHSWCVLFCLLLATRVQQHRTQHHEQDLTHTCPWVTVRRSWCVLGASSWQPQCQARQQLLLHPVLPVNWAKK